MLIDTCNCIADKAALAAGETVVPTCDSTESVHYTCSPRRLASFPTASKATPGTTTYLGPAA